MRTTGIVKWFNDEKGYGFITVDGSKKDIFVHHSAVARADAQRVVLREGDRVDFEVEQQTKGPAAKDVRRSA